MQTQVLSLCCLSKYIPKSRVTILFDVKERLILDKDSIMYMKKGFYSLRFLCQNKNILNANINKPLCETMVLFHSNCCDVLYLVQGSCIDDADVFQL